MAFILLFVLLVSTSICFSEHTETAEQLEVQFYYESIGEDSKYYYKYDFYDMYKKLGSSVNILTYPFGSAKFVDANRTKVMCKHGEEECYGDKLHACAIDLLPQKYIEFNRCLIIRRSDNNAADTCGRSQGVDSESIKKCANSQKGQDLLIKAGIETYKVRPSYTPYILINGKEFQVLTCTCTQFKNPPEACKNL